MGSFPQVASQGAWRGWERRRSPCCPSLGPAAPTVPGRGVHSTPPKLVCPGRRVFPTGGVDSGPLLRRHHSHLPVGGLQPPGAARAGPVRHHLAAPAVRPSCSPPTLPSQGIRIARSCLETFKEQQHQEPPPPLTTPLQAGPALPDLPGGWPTSPLLLHLENQGKMSSAHSHSWLVLGQHGRWPCSLSLFQNKMIMPPSLARLGVLGGCKSLLQEGMDEGKGGGAAG